MLRIACLFIAASLHGPLASADPQPAPRSSPDTARAAPGDAQSRYAKAADYSAACSGRAVLILIDGKPVFERYDHGWSADRRHPLASGTKSFTGVVAACAVQDGLITWDERASDTITEWKPDPRKSGITVRELLSLSSGLDPADAAFGTRGGGILLGEGARKRSERLGNTPSPSDRFKAAVDVPATHDPGEKFEYGPSHFYAFGEMLQRKIKARHAADPAFPDATYFEYMKRRVLAPVGLAESLWGLDAAGNPNLPGGCLLTAREWARFGEMIRLNGRAVRPDGSSVQVVPPEILAECFKPSRTNSSYGLTWWLMTGVSPEAQIIADGLLGRRIRDQNQRRQAADVRGPDGKPLTVYMAAGLGKQRLYVIPQYNMVVVRFAEATRQGTSFDNAEFLAPILGIDPPPSSPPRDRILDE